jgi:hypothetical protein
MEHEPLPADFQVFSLSLELGPFPATKFRVRSHSEDRTFYEIDLNKQSCTCPNFQKTRTGYPHGHMGRFCKHLMEELSSRKAFAGASEWHRAIADEGYGGPALAWLVDLEPARQILITADPSSDWINVFARAKRAHERSAEASGKIKRFGWYIPERRWSYGAAPPGARQIRARLKELTLPQVSRSDGPREAASSSPATGMTCEVGSPMQYPMSAGPLGEPVQLRTYASARAVSQAPGLIARFKKLLFG